jgi:hypothetical protein
MMTKDSSLNKDDLLSMHPWITNKLEQIRGFRRRFRTAANRLDFVQSVQEQRQTARDLRGCMKELLTCLTEHLARLETALLPIIRDCFSEEWREGGEWKHLLMLGILCQCQWLDLHEGDTLT